MPYSRLKRLLVVGVIGACLFGAGCQSLEEMAPPVTGATGNVSALSHGRSLFVTRCATCHGITPVADHSYAEWQGIVTEMAERSKLVGTDEGDILAYLRTVSRH